MGKSNSSWQRSRTSFCAHGWIVPGRPEVWLPDPEDRKAFTINRKISRFCPDCWKQHAAAFEQYGYSQSDQGVGDFCSYGFQDRIFYTVRDHGRTRDADAFEAREVDLRMLLLEKREILVKKDQARLPEYIGVALRNYLMKLQTKKKSGDWVELHSRAYTEYEIDGDDYNPEDESQHSARIYEAAGDVDAAAGVSTPHARDSILDSAGAQYREQVKRLDPLLAHIDEPEEETPQPKKRIHRRTAGDLVKAAIAEQKHRLDALAVLTGAERESFITKGADQVLEALKTLPDDEALVMRMRFLNGNGLREGKPRPRVEIVKELHASGRFLSEFDIRNLEKAARLRLRNRVKLPPVFLNSTDE